MSQNFRETIHQPSDRVILALDKMNWDQASQMVSEVGPYMGMSKANSIAQRKGWEHAVGTFAGLGTLTMADAKFHDTPDTVYEEVKEVASCGARLITVHISGGKEMLEAAVEGRDAANMEFPVGLLGITILTSLEEDVEEIYGDNVANKVLQFAEMAAETNLDGIVCSGAELEVLKARDDLDNLVTVVPGINLAGSKVHRGQKRVVAPGEAVSRGADFIVLGSTVTKAQVNLGITPVNAAKRALSEIASA